MDSIWLKIDIESEQDDAALRYDEQGNVVISQGLVDGRLNDAPVTRSTIRKKLRPTLKFVKHVTSPDSNSLTDDISGSTSTIPEGSVMVVFSHKNLDNIARYHIMNNSSNLYFMGTLPKNGQN